MKIDWSQNPTSGHYRVYIKTEVPSKLSFVKAKLREAKYFFSLMERSLHNPIVFGFHLSAFISAARSVTFIMQTSCSGVPGFDEWYATKRGQMMADEDMKLFDNQRDRSIHERPVVFDGEITFQIEEQEPETVSMTGLWHFEERPDDDILALARSHPNKLRALVNEAVQTFHVHFPIAKHHKVNMHQQPNGDVILKCIELPCEASGRTYEDAAENLKVVIQNHIDAQPYIPE